MKKDVFFSQITKILFTYDDYDHAINLIFEFFFYDSLYNMSSKKLKILREYIDDNLTNDRI